MKPLDDDLNLADSTLNKSEEGFNRNELSITSCDNLRNHATGKEYAVEKCPMRADQQKTNGIKRGM